MIRGNDHKHAALPRLRAHRRRLAAGSIRRPDVATALLCQQQGLLLRAGSAGRCLAAAGAARPGRQGLRRRPVRPIPRALLVAADVVPAAPVGRPSLLPGPGRPPIALRGRQHDGPGRLCRALAGAMGPPPAQCCCWRRRRLLGAGSVRVGGYPRAAAAGRQQPRQGLVRVGQGGEARHHRAR
eukprot:4132566-Prymnesium_polylepis.1